MNENENNFDFDESALKYLRQAFGEPKKAKKKKKKSKKAPNKVKLVELRKKKKSKKSKAKKNAFNKLFNGLNMLYTKVYLNRKKYGLSKKNALKLIRDMILG